MTQVARRADGRWEVTRVSQVAGFYEYEYLGRVVFDGVLYRVDAVRWTDAGYEHDRWPRGYQLLQGAVRALERGRLEASS